MLIVLSPAKTLDYESPLPTERHSQPDFLDHSRELVKQLRDYSPADVAELMGISDKLGELNHRRFMNWQTPFNPDNARPAALAFKGDVYTGLEAQTFSEEDFEFAQQHLRILSGLYGLLRPLDLMQPYRLEMGTRLSNPRGKDLYTFWGEHITEALNEQLGASGGEVLVNLASNEYFRAVRPKVLRAEVITPVFKDFKGGKYKVISFHAKKARGLMARWVIRNRVTNVERLRDFDEGGYRYAPDQSSAREWVFTRDAQ